MLRTMLRNREGEYWGWRKLSYINETIDFDLSRDALYVLKKDGKIVARHKVETTGEAKKLAAETDKPMATKKNPNAPQWKADGMDLQHVTVTAVDSKGRRVLNANQEVTFAVEGPAEIVGVINGDINSPELTVGSKRSLWNGTCTVILRSTRQAGAVTLTATVPGLKPVKLPLLTR